NGSAVGRVHNGVIRVTDPVASDGLGFDFSGCEEEHDRGTSTTICRGKDLRFRAIGGKYQIGLKGAGIYLSAVGHGYAVLNGAGDDPNVDVDGTYSLNDGPYRSLPDFLATVLLVAPAAGSRPEILSPWQRHRPRQFGSSRTTPRSLPSSLRTLR